MLSVCTNYISIMTIWCLDVCSNTLRSVQSESSMRINIMTSTRRQHCNRSEKEALLGSSSPSLTIFDVLLMVSITSLSTRSINDFDESFAFGSWLTSLWKSFPFAFVIDLEIISKYLTIKNNLIIFYLWSSWQPS